MSELGRNKPHIKYYSFFDSWYCSIKGVATTWGDTPEEAYLRLVNKLYVQLKKEMNARKSFWQRLKGLFK